MTASAVVVGETNKPRRPPSHAKKHFSKCYSRWKCNYCDMSYGCNTATSNFWKHLSSKHPNKLNKNDERYQSSSTRWRQNVRPPLRRRIGDQDNVAIEQATSYLYEHPAHLCPEEMSTIASKESETAAAIFNTSPTLPPSSTTKTNINNPTTIHDTIPFALVPTMDQQLRYREIGMEQIVFDVIRNNPRFAELFHNHQIQALFRRATPTFAVDNINEIEHEVLQIQRDKMAADLSRYRGGYYLYVEPLNLWRNGVFHMTVMLVHEKLDDSDDLLAAGDVMPDGGEMESLLLYNRNQCHLLALVELRPEVTANDHVEEVASAVEAFRVASKLLGIVFGKFDGSGDFAAALHNRLRRYGAYSCKTYATRESIGTDLKTNLHVFRQNSAQIKEELLKCLHYLDQIEQSHKMADASASWRQVIDSNKISTETKMSHMVTESFKNLSWDLMPILPHISHIKRYLTERRALGLDYNYNCGTQWIQLKLTLQELTNNLRCATCQQMEQMTHKNGDHVISERMDLLRKLLEKMEAFPASCAAVLSFLSVTKLTSPFTRKIVKAVEKLPKGLSEDTQKNILFLKMWTKFKVAN